MQHFGRIMALTLGLVVFAWLSNASAQEQFYKGKTIKIVVGFSAGGGYDVYSRTIARHIGKHIPGNPAIIVENMTGAGSMLAANYTYKVAKPDGLTIGHFTGGLFLQQLLSKPGIEFDGRDFKFIGVPSQDHFVFTVSKASAITDVDQWISSKKVLTVGGVAPGGGTDDIPKVLHATIGLPLRLVSGFKGTADIRLAFNSGEVSAASTSWESLKVTWSREYQSGEAVIVLQSALKSHPELTQYPVAVNLAKTDEGKKLLAVVFRVHGPSVRPYVLGPKTPRDRVQILRHAFNETMKDPEFLADANKSKLDISPLTGQELEANVNEVFKLESGLIEKLKDILK